MNQTLILICGIAIIFFATTLGAMLVFVFKKEISPKINTVFLGFAAGVMIAASVWSLIIPALEYENDTGIFRVIPVALGIILGGLFLVLLDVIVPHLHKNSGVEEGPKTNLTKSTKLFLAVTIHNIPEGLAVGLAFGAALLTKNDASYLAAFGLALGIAMQNLPEGAAISLPMVKVTGSKRKAFLYGTISGIVEPLAACVGILLAVFLAPFMPWLLSFGAGAMLFVVAEDLIPDAKLSEDSHLGTWAVLIGFVVMMILDVVLG